ncbi:MAG: PilN domain-containing protein [Halothiobacillaceae bacterium]|jgi:type IV pilus assembly protein PilN|nr:PilN domain-containing protein [Halothiobacillaceae bacterium]MDY0050217.1 PilN domain-containing protein [Halothiobacillaceae bacterium]
MAHINLLPWREERRKQRQKEYQTQLGITALAAAAVMLGVHMFYQGLIDEQNTRNAFLKNAIVELDKKIVEIKSLEETRQQLIGRMEVIQKLQASRPNIVHVMDVLVRTVPDGIQLESVSVQNDKEINIQGTSESAARVAEYLRTINTSGWLGGAAIIGQGILANTKDPDALGRYVFTIKGNITPPKPEAEQKEAAQ